LAKSDLRCPGFLDVRDARDLLKKCHVLPPSRASDEENPDHGLGSVAGVHKVGEPKRCWRYGIYRVVLPEVPAILRVALRAGKKHRFCALQKTCATEKA
jgi:hypothetical protein